MAPSGLAIVRAAPDAVPPSPPEPLALGSVSGLSLPLHAVSVSAVAMLSATIEDFLILMSSSLKSGPAAPEPWCGDSPSVSRAG
ncbi:hypothetical protein GCM10025876_26430 [Demequina litorisediminis]|uniref:Uncharacterized protein n=1 Tax=Demequina litorisediminis TaxID=1849022 RepID=A0ABQ6IFC7_9MICO|nr:hypothetical protein GCM10025876_26430 [Demequina litorisediminis]